MFPSSKGPYTWHVNGRPVMKRDGSPRSHSALSRVKVPACRECNGILATRFELPAKPLIRRLFEADGHADFDGAEAHTVALWLLKTWLLLAHPAAIDSAPGVAPEGWGDVHDDLWTWVVKDQPPPEGLSLWARRRPLIRPSGPLRHIPLPTIAANGRETRFACKRAGVGFVDISLVYHPGWPIEHPLERDGHVLRLWPRDPDMPTRFSSLADTGEDIAWLKGPRLHFFDGMFPHPELPPLSADLNVMTDLPIQFLRMAAW